ncbi:hypothetical protein BSR29_00930 [Boudabousia liubingyangii]|uniref:Probable membrane transporter protein n=1 Tax=Boudabousia liubingyangii TaxID=1921764 RepID=A0A1Q5PPV5_9ACTO|nr:sulfite exporter TauE/SafE family protein [Boudabousia liubingyangii]OKL48421.1 hypothetical protein BSR28_01590 [Boudabousia liubingyangii]OKL49553.1 hypothetical protein BSR29_00930 [Boudabousia liubingyangii]
MIELILTSATVGIAVGIVVGALGAGGGILSVPILTYLLAQEPHAATNGSLVIVAVTALFALPGKAKRGQVRWMDGLIFGALSTVGAIIGRQINHALGGGQLFILFAILLLSVSVYMFYNAYQRSLVEQGKSKKQTAPPTGERNIIMVIIAATATGLLTGLFGVGGGFAVVPVLMLVMKFSMREASGTSLVVMIIAACVSMATGLVQGQFQVDWPTVLLFTAGSAVGGLIGGPLSQKAKASTLTYIFAVLLVLVAGYTLYRSIGA